jgi:hypothetical protein
LFCGFMTGAVVLVLALTPPLAGLTSKHHGPPGREGNESLGLVLASNEHAAQHCGA